MSDIERAIARLFVPRKEGMGYYPFGLDKPGYLVDRQLLDDSAAVERSGSQRALLGVAFVGLLLYIVLPNIAAVHPAVLPIATSPIIRIAIAIPLLVIIYALVMWRRRRLLKVLLLDRKAKMPALTAAEALAHRAAYWQMTPRFARIAMFVLRAARRPGHGALCRPAHPPDRRPGTPGERAGSPFRRGACRPVRIP